ncbi:S-methyl-5'-thioadenosine phosphorylase-like [Lineus longissimus]|uniref:S-methyl-5'-thioadenosine phosphorylase-like n=1 Tax=Lineus longissimus TaxID=88925 RepID=UPI002B4F0507
MKVVIGIIGGSGIDDPDIIENREEVEVETPFGKTSDCLIKGTIKGVDCILLARHGKKHTISPTNVNFRANLWALKNLGCTHILVTTACGSLQEDKKPGEIVILDQFIDRTQKRVQTFYDGEHDEFRGILHLPLHEPFCPHTSKILQTSAKTLNIDHHNTGTMLSIEGPRFSSRAESKLFHSWGADCINMTTVPEVILAKELGICYAALALVTDYDSWRDKGEHVSVEGVLSIMKGNAMKAKKILCDAIPQIGQQDWTAILQANTSLVKNSTML